MAKRKTKAQKEAEALEVETPVETQETETKVEDEQISGDDLGVETQTEEIIEVQDGGTDSSDSEQPKEDLVDVSGQATSSSESQGLLESQPKPQSEPKVSHKQSLGSNKGIVTENPLSVGVPINEVPIRHLPGFENGSRRNPNDPHEVRTAREALKRLREEG